MGQKSLKPPARQRASKGQQSAYKPHQLNQIPNTFKLPRKIQMYDVEDETQSESVNERETDSKRQRLKE